MNLDLPDIACMSDAAKAISAILKAVGAGEIAPMEAKALSDMVAACANICAGSEANSDYSRQAEMEVAAAEFDRKLAQRSAIWGSRRLPSA